MVNHFRTLLLNDNGSNVPGKDFPGEEYVDPLFRAVSLPTFLTVLRGILFGTAPDRAAMNYRLRQYMMLLHSTAMHQHVVALDPRITYLPFTDQTLFLSTFKTSVNQITGSATLFVNGVQNVADLTGRSFYQWTITILTNTTVQIDQVVPIGPSLIYSYTSTDGLSSAVPLGSSGLTVQFPTNELSSWQVLSYGRPVDDVSTILARAKVAGQANLDQLFGVGTPLVSSEPFKTFSNLWGSHYELAYQLGGLLAAVAYRTDQIRQTGSIA